MSVTRGSYTQSQKLMTFVLSMSLYGLATLISSSFLPFRLVS